jgi:hypothetical protein
MLFLGTAKYPKEEEYEEYLGKHGGMSNAYTDMEDTNYYFNVSPLDHTAESGSGENDDDNNDEDEESGDGQRGQGTGGVSSALAGALD